ncbi:hypothetical protein [Rhodoferax sp. GW822-FHT02A01]|uniref:hypothetical protein n=1 Tax=Rhodoferax sp. GW822-FHT02A01 TaxID=3141537 RepID=UPI00315DCC02
MTPAHITRLLTFAQHGQPKDYAASDMMRSDLEAVLMATKQPASAAPKAPANAMAPAQRHIPTPKSWRAKSGAPFIDLQTHANQVLEVLSNGGVPQHDDLVEPLFTYEDMLEFSGHKHVEEQQPASAWVGLTDEEINAMWPGSSRNYIRAVPFARAIESALRSKNAAPQQAQAKEALEAARDALDTAKTGLDWYRDRCPEAVDGSDDEANEQIDAALTRINEVLEASK